MTIPEKGLGQGEKRIVRKGYVKGLLDMSVQPDFRLSDEAKEDLQGLVSALTPCSAAIKFEIPNDNRSYMWLRLRLTVTAAMEQAFEPPYPTDLRTLAGAAALLAQCGSATEGE